MLEPQRMDRVLIVGTKDVMEPTIDALHDLNLVHIEDYVDEEEYFHIGKPLTKATSLSEKLLKLRSIKSYLGTKELPPAPQSRENVLKALDASLASLEQAVTRLTSEKSALDSSIKELNRRADILVPYEALGLPLELLTGYDTVTVFTGTVPGDVEPAVKAVTGDYELYSAPYGKGFIIALFAPKAVAGKVSETLMKSGYTEIEPLREKGEPAAIHRSIDEARAKAEERLKQVNAELADLNKKHANFILSSDELLTMDTQKAEAPLRFATSENTFVAEGWVPTPDFEKLRDTLEKVTGGKVYVTKIEPAPKAYKGEVEPGVHEHHEVDAPVKYDNPTFLGPIQSFIDLYGRPKYDELDPTILFALVFPLFYGFILGDIGYGLVALGLTLVVKRLLKHSSGMQVLLNVFLICAISSIIFGVLFGEFFGFSIAEKITTNIDGVKEGGIWGMFSLYDYNIYPHALTIGPLGPISLPLERMKPGGFDDLGSYVFGIKDLLVFTCLVGVCHLLLGYILGFRNELKQHNLKTAILHKGSWFTLLLGGVLLIWYVFPLVLAQDMGSLSVTNPLFLAGVILMVLGLILILMGEGALGLIEITNPLSHTLSYTRLLAVGLSSVGIAFAINHIAGMMGGAGIIGIIGAIIVLVLGHTINLVLGIYAPFIQSLRLHYVEFFQKFYKSGGKIYDPFGYIRKYTED
jgi:V/A-type H+/Na+-transporting ATPase subunit I